jgi:hypothetical protein
MKQRILCQKCVYYYVTWQSKQPHGCKAYNFKSKQLPSIVVKKNSDMDCSFFKLKNK